MTDVIPDPWSPEDVDLITLVADLAALVSGMRQIIQDVVDVRQAHSYVWDDDAARAAQLGMGESDTGYQIDTSEVWTFIEGVWHLTGGELPTFSVIADTVQNVADTTNVTLSSCWDTPTINTGFASWSGGVLEFKHGGTYLLTATIHWEASTVGRRIMWLAKGATSHTVNLYGRDEREASSIGGMGTTSIVSTFATVDPGDTVQMRVLQDSGGSLAPATVMTYFGVRYLGPTV